MNRNTDCAVSAHTWFDSFTRSYAAEIGYVFLLSGNIADLFPFKDEFVTMRQFWARQLSGREIAVFWDMSMGFSFADEILGLPLEKGKISMREKFKIVTGLNQQTQGDDTATLLNTLTGNINSGNLPTDPKEVFRVLEKLLSQGQPEDRKAAVVIEYIESVISENDYSSVPVVTVQRWASLDSPLKGTGNPVILIERNPEKTSDAIKHDDSSVVHIHIPRPTQEELKMFIRHNLKINGAKLAKGLNISTAANLSAGLRCKDFDDFCMKSLESNNPISINFIWSKKINLIEKQSGGVLQVVRPKHGFEAIGGLEQVKEALNVQIKNLRSGSKTADKGWILMGPPGTGKTIVAESLAKESGVNFALLGNILSKYVGESQRNMRLALDIARAMTPTIIFIDEAAETLGDGNGYNGDSGTSDHIRGMLQNTMGDESIRGKLFFMLATNYPNRLPPAMMREGRMDKRIPLLAPDQNGRKSIFQALCKKYNICSINIDFLSAINATEGWTGAELGELLLRAKQFSEERNKSKPVETEDLKNALEDYIVSRDQQAFDLMTALAIRFTNSRRLLPEKYREHIEQVDNRINELETKLANRKTKRNGNLIL